MHQAEKGALHGTLMPQWGECCHPPPGADVSIMRLVQTLLWKVRPCDAALLDSEGRYSQPPLTVIEGSVVEFQVSPKDSEVSLQNCAGDDLCVHNEALPLLGRLLLSSKVLAYVKLAVCISFGLQ